jgi:peptidylprolyl isomerase
MHRKLTSLLICAAWLCLPGWTPTQAADDVIWREVDPENIVVMTLNEGTVYIELNPGFAPETVKQFKGLIDSRFYDALTFYRVIDGFVAQAGDGSDLGLASNVPTIDSEFEIDWSKELPYMRVQKDDFFADETGFIDGFPVGRDKSTDRAWLLHCPGIVAMARGNDADSSRSDFYIVLGQAPRYLDRNMNVFGRVVLGMDVVQRIRRGPKDRDGLISSDTAKSRIRSMILYSDVPEEDRMFLYVADTSDKSFKSMLKTRKNRNQPFFHAKPPRVLDACQVPVPSRITK